MGGFVYATESGRRFHKSIVLAFCGKLFYRPQKTTGFSTGNGLFTETRRNAKGIFQKSIHTGVVF
jgi:hypothetical protein